jgi:hypothetical protein
VGPAAGVTAVRSLLAGLVDYAGLYPPASLSMADAVREYAHERAGAHAFVLGRFVLGAARLREFKDAASTLPSPRAEPWRLSVLLGEDPAADLAALPRQREVLAPFAEVDSVEGKAGDATAADHWLGELPPGLHAYVEVPLEPLPEPLLGHLKARGARAKARTGGTSAAAIPSAAVLARFLHACVRLGLPWKATAGLHHPLRSERPFTYERDSARGLMHGFLNVFLAATLLREGRIGAAEAEALLEDGRPESFAADRDGIAWAGRRVSAREIASARAGFAASFGSCSFREPVDDLRTLGWL